MKKEYKEELRKVRYNVWQWKGKGERESKNQRRRAKKKEGRKRIEGTSLLCCFAVGVRIFLLLLVHPTILTSMTSVVGFLHMNRFDIVQIYRQYCGNNFLLLPHCFKFSIPPISLQFLVNFCFLKPLESHSFWPWMDYLLQYLFLEIYVCIFLLMFVIFEDIGLLKIWMLLCFQIWLVAKWFWMLIWSEEISVPLLFGTYINSLDVKECKDSIYASPFGRYDVSGFRVHANFLFWPVSFLRELWIYFFQTSTVITCRLSEE